MESPGAGESVLARAARQAAHSSILLLATPRASPPCLQSKMMRWARCQALFWLVVLYTALAKTDAQCAVTNTDLPKSTAANPIVVDINMRTSISFIATILKARRQIAAYSGKVAKDPKKGEKNLCYAMDNWILRITRNQPVVDDKEEKAAVASRHRRLPPKSDKKASSSKNLAAGAAKSDTAGAKKPGRPTLTRDFFLEDDIYLSYVKGSKVPHIYSKDKKDDVFDWSTAVFDTMMRTPGTPDNVYVRSSLYIIAESIRFDWMRNRVAAAIDFEWKNPPITAIFKIPKSQLLNGKWAEEGKLLGIPESVVAEKYLSGYSPQWEVEQGEEMPPISFCDSYGAKAIFKGLGREPPNPQCANIEWAILAQLEEAKQCLDTADDVDKKSATLKATDAAKKKELEDRAQELREEAVETYTNLEEYMQKKGIVPDDGDDQGAKAKVSKKDKKAAKKGQANPCKDPMSEAECKAEAAEIRTQIKQAIAAIQQAEAADQQADQPLTPGATPANAQD